MSEDTFFGGATKGGDRVSEVGMPPFWGGTVPALRGGEAEGISFGPPKIGALFPNLSVSAEEPGGLGLVGDTSFGGISIQLSEGEADCGPFHPGGGTTSTKL